MDDGSSDLASRESREARARITREFEAAFVQACTLDVVVRKPGNVSEASPGHGMQASQFIASARAAAPALARPGASVGERIEAAVGETLLVAGCNTNLGIVLLGAPIAAALELLPPGPCLPALQGAVEEVLLRLDVDDARAAFRAIATARPGGLGEVEEEDVRQPPSVSLRQAMALAAGRDSIARQYTEGARDLFNTGLASFVAQRRGIGPRSADATVQRVYLAFLSRWPDSHIVRKHGEAVAHTVMNRARAWLARAEAGELLDAAPDFAAWDEEMKAAGINPGTSADLTVATLLLAGILRIDDSLKAPQR